MKYVKNSSTSLGESSLIPAYTASPLSTRAAAYQRERYGRGVADWTQEVKYSFGDYGNTRLMPQKSTSNSETLMRTPTDMSQWISS